MKKRTPVTQKEIAKRAGVSQTVVSLALNNSYDVTLSEETRQRVLDVAAELGYVPQAAAKSLIQGHTDNIGLILIQPHYQVFRDPYIPNILTGLSGVVRENGFRLIVEHIDDLNDLITIRHMVKSGEVAGIILSNFHWAEEVATPLLEEEYPIVLLDTRQKGNYPTVSLDHFGGIAKGLQHMIDLGYRHIACITYGPRSHLHINQRLAVFRETLIDRGLAYNERYVRFGEYDPISGYMAMQSLLMESQQPDAVFGMNDMMALGALRAILDAGLRIPEDMAVVGYDDMRFAEFTNPALTTVRAPEVELGHVAGEMLIDLIHGRSIPERQVLLETQLIVRDSCGAGLKNSNA